MKKLVMTAAMFAVLSASAAITITGVSARQRWPWNGLVDVDFTISGAAADEAFVIDLDAEYADGAMRIAAHSFAAEPVVKGSATHRVTWDMANDYPDFRASDLRVSVTATPYTPETPVYMVIDISGGKDAVKYPVRYARTLPHVQGGMDEPCQTTEIWLRRVASAGQVFTFNNYAKPADDNNAFWVKLTKNFYIGVFEITQKQWNLMAGTWPSSFSNETYRASRPLDSYYPVFLFGKSGCTWSSENQTIPANSLLQKLRDKTGLATLNLPTEAQWNFAACGGKITTPDKTYSEYHVYNGYSRDSVARYSATQDAQYEGGNCGTNSGTACVGSYLPNKFGLYDMLGNVWEDCLDRYVSTAALKNYYVTNNCEFPLIDPQGIPVASATALNGGKGRTVMRSSNYGLSSGYVTLWDRRSGYTSYSGDDKPYRRGIRFCVTVE